MQKHLIIILSVAILTLSGCSSLSVPGAHKIDIQQGNVITQDMLDKLKPGMDKSQVRFVLGTPTIVDVFHQERWDYVYSFQQGGQDREQRRISLFFADEKLARMEGDIVPATGIREQQAPKETVVTVPGSNQEKGLFSSIKRAVGLGKKDSTGKAPASATENRPPESTDSSDITPDSAEVISP